MNRTLFNRPSLPPHNDQLSDSFRNIPCYVQQFADPQTTPRDKAQYLRSIKHLSVERQKTCLCNPQFVSILKHHKLIAEIHGSNLFRKTNYNTSFWDVLRYSLVYRVPMFPRSLPRPSSRCFEEATNNFFSTSISLRPGNFICPKKKGVEVEKQKCDNCLF